MAHFFFNTFSEKPLIDQWADHLTINHYINDGKDFINQKTVQIDEMISGHIDRINSQLANLQVTNESQFNAIKDSANQICGSIDAGYQEMGNHLKSINFELNSMRYEISDMSAMIDEHLTLILFEARLSNLLVGNIAELLKIPEIQKKRQYYVSQGLKFLKNAVRDNSFYEHALESFNKALAIEKTDYFTLFNLGLIHLYSTEDLNPSKARDYFLKSAKFALAESNLNENKNYLINEGTDSPSITSSEDFKFEAARAFLQASKASYLESDFNESVLLANRALEVLPNYIEAQFQKAKSLSLNNEVSKAVLLVEQMVHSDRYYVLKVVGDGDLITKKAIKNKLTLLKEDAKEKVTSLLNEIKAKVTPESITYDYFKQILDEDDQCGYLSYLKVIDSIYLKRVYQFENWVKDISNDRKMIYFQDHRCIALNKNGRTTLSNFKEPFLKKEFDLIEVINFEYANLEEIRRYEELRQLLLKKRELTIIIATNKNQLNFKTNLVMSGGAMKDWWVFALACLSFTAVTYFADIGWFVKFLGVLALIPGVSLGFGYLMSFLIDNNLKDTTQDFFKGVSSKKEAKQSKVALRLIDKKIKEFESKV